MGRRVTKEGLGGGAGRTGSEAKEEVGEALVDAPVLERDVIADDDAVCDGNPAAAHACNQPEEQELAHRARAAAEDRPAAEEAGGEHARPAPAEDVGQPAVERRELRSRGRGGKRSVRKGRRSVEVVCARRLRTQQTERR